MHLVNLCFQDASFDAELAALCTASRRTPPNASRNSATANAAPEVSSKLVRRSRRL